MSDLRTPVTAAEEPGVSPGPDIARLAELMGLDDVETELAQLVVDAALDPDLPTPTVLALLDAVPGSTLAMFAPDAALRLTGVQSHADRPLLHAPVGVDDRVVLHLAGHDGPDVRLLPYVRALGEPDQRLPPSRRRAGSAVQRVLTRAVAAARVELRGPDSADRLDVIAAALAAADRPGWVAGCAGLPSSPTERDAFARLWNREWRLTGAVLVLDAETVDPDPEMLARIDGAVVVSCRHATDTGIAAVVEVDRPERSEQEELWAVRLTRSGAARHAARFDLAHSDIRAVIDDADPGGAVRRRLRRRLDRLAQRIEPWADWDDLVVTPPSMALLRHLVEAATGRRTLDEHGVGAETTRGRGLTALFSGPSGTGKTLAAEVIAGRLGLDLYRVDLSAAVSKWIGETEKHLRLLFDAAEAGGAVLLFDEADALFGRRTEIRDSHDRYANLEVSYLLQRLEEFRGIALLTTNMRAAIDPAFMRRLSMVVPFAHPGPDERIELWRRAFPRSIVAEDLDLERLAALDLTGGQITNIARHATLAAAAGGVRSPVTMSTIRDAAIAELSKTDRSPSELVGLDRPRDRGAP